MRVSEREEDRTVVVQILCGGKTPGVRSGLTSSVEYYSRWNNTGEAPGAIGNFQTVFKFIVEF